MALITPKPHCGGELPVWVQAATHTHSSAGGAGARHSTLAMSSTNERDPREPVSSPSACWASVLPAAPFLITSRSSIATQLLRVDIIHQMRSRASALGVRTALRDGPDAAR